MVLAAPLQRVEVEVGVVKVVVLVETVVVGLGFPVGPPGKHWEYPISRNQHPFHGSGLLTSLQSLCLVQVEPETQVVSPVQPIP